MKFSYHDTVKWHDTDANRRVRPSQILTYMQEAANLQMAANSRNLDRLRDEEGLAFLLSRISIRIYSQLHAYDSFDSETWIVDGHGAASTRCFRILREGEVMAEGVSLWALMNIREHRLLRASAFDHGFPGDEAISLPELPVRFPVPAVQDMTLVGERHIVYSDLDYNGHMNNTRYPDMLCDFTDGILSRQVVGLTMSFLHEATFGHTLQVLRLDRGEEHLFRTVDADGATCLEARLLTEPVRDAREV